MSVKLTRKTIHVNGMTGTKCEAEIENALSKLDGVIEAKAIYSNSSVYVTYDATVLKPLKITDAIGQLGYVVLVSESKENTDRAKVLEQGAVSKVLHMISKVLSLK